MAKQSTQVGRFEEGTKVSDPAFRDRLNDAVESLNSEVNGPTDLTKPPTRLNGPIFAKLTGEGQSTGTYTAEECDAAGNTLTNGRQWDSGNSSVLADLHDLNGIDGWYNDSKGIVVEVARGTNTSPDPSEAYWYIRHVLGTSTSPKAVGASNETEAAATDSWDRTDQGNNDGVTVTCLTRMAYDDAGNETLYAYYRDFKYDSLGYLYEIGQETRATIDTPEACS